METTEEKYVPKRLIKYKNIVLVIAGIIASLYCVYSSIIIGELKRKSEQLDQELKEQSFKNELRFKIFDEVKQAINKDTSGKYKHFVWVMVEQMLEDDTIFKERMRSVLIQSDFDTSVVRKIQENETFDEEQGQLEKTSTPGNVGISNTKATKTRIDVFYLESDNGSLTGKAEAIKRLIEKKFPGKYDIRPRLLPLSINAKKGYRLSRDEIRFDEVEQVDANAINNTIKAGFSPFFMKKISFETPHYISVFLVE